MPPRNVESVLPLTLQQQGALFAGLRSRPELSVRQLQWTLEGELDVALLRRAWHCLCDRHSMLRTAFAWRDQEQPYQVTLRRVEMPVRVLDWRRLDRKGQQRSLRAFLAEDRQRGLRLSSPPLLRLSLIRLRDDLHRDVWTFHRVLMDGWSYPVVLRELWLFYRALEDGREPELEAPAPYGDFVAWQRGRDLARAESYWRDALRGFAAPTPLGRRKEPRDGGAPEGYGVLEKWLPAAKTETLRAWVRRRRLTWSTLVQGLWAVLLSRYSGRQDVLFGTTASGRPAGLPGIESMVGLFTTTLPLRVTVPASGALGPWLRELQSRHIGLREYQYCTAGQIHGWSEVPSSQPLFDSVVVFQNYPLAHRAGSFGGEKLRVRQSGVSVAHGDHALTFMAAADDQMTLQLVHDRARLDDGTRVPEHFALLLDLVAAGGDPDLAALRLAIPEHEVPEVAPRSPARARPEGERPLPRTALEVRVAALWGEALGLDRVYLDDDFFQLGGHSLEAVRLTDRLRRELDVDLPLGELFAAGTVGELAEAVARRRREAGGTTRRTHRHEASAAGPEERHEPFPLSAAQRFCRGERGAGALYMELDFERPGADLRVRLEAALRRLIARHDMLRVTLLPGARQKVRAEPPGEISWVEPAPEEAAATLAETRERMLFGRPETDGWLLEMRAHRLSDRVRLHVRFDSLVTDGGSRLILLRDLARLLREPAARLPPLECTYRDFVLAQRSWRREDAYRRARDYWMGRLAELPPAPELPRASPAPGAPARLRVRRAPLLDAGARQRLEGLAAAAGLTTSVVVLAAFAEALAQRTGRPRFTLGVLGSHRPPIHPQIRQVVGNFSVVHLLAVDAAAGDFLTRAKDLQDQLTRALEHHRFSGYDVLSELRRRRGALPEPALPVLFSSVLEYAKDARRPAATRPATEPEPFRVADVSVSNPNVLLEPVVNVKSDGVLRCKSLAAEEALAAGFIPDLLDAYARRLRLLADAGGWAEPRSFHLSMEAVRP